MQPFHEGHDYLLKEARRITQADYIIVVMSGDYVHGVNLLSLINISAQTRFKSRRRPGPGASLYMACGSGIFCLGGIFQLENWGRHDLCFGSETGDLDHLAQCARILSC